MDRSRFVDPQDLAPARRINGVRIGGGDRPLIEHALVVGPVLSGGGEVGRRGAGLLHHEEPPRPVGGGDELIGGRQPCREGPQLHRNSTFGNRREQSFRVRPSRREADHRYRSQ